jgi:NAD(P)-dependent dehydrogenase (short-subunit alcohol dehydrogenase family)
MNEFHQRVVVVTGASGNLGRAAAPVFEVDLIDPASTDRAIADVVDAYGRIDVLANIAGGFRMGPLIQDTADEDWDCMLDLNARSNARSVFHPCRRVIPLMLENGGGRIVNVSARAAQQGKGRMGPYCASKAAVITPTETLAAENKFDNINVNCILPDTIDTPQHRADMTAADFARWVPPAAPADVVVFLASDAARGVSGAAIPVFGQS